MIRLFNLDFTFDFGIKAFSLKNPNNILNVELLKKENVNFAKNEKKKYQQTKIISRKKLFKTSRFEKWIKNFQHF